MSDQWRDVVEQEKRQRDQRVAQDKYHGTQEMYRLEQDAAHEGHFHGAAPEMSQPGLLARIKSALMRLLKRG
jgi:hypothetical protein